MKSEVEGSRESCAPHKSRSHTNKYNEQCPNMEIYHSMYKWTTFYHEME